MPGKMAKSVVLILGLIWKPQGHSGEGRIKSKTREWECQAEGGRMRYG